MTTAFAINHPVNSALASAAGWTVIAEPIIKAYLALDQIEHDLQSGALLTGSRFYADIVSGAAVSIGRLQEALYAEITSVRDNMISDVFIPGPLAFRRPDVPVEAAAWDAGWNASEEANERVSRETIAVDAAIKRMERSL